MKKLVIFGFDGTLADTSPGILYCFNTTAAAMGYEPVDHDALYGVIGIPLEQGLKKLFDMTDDEIEYAANNYSKLYSQKGKEMFTLYDGLEDSLHRLKENGFKIAVATQKHIMFTTDMLNIYGITELFDAVCATDVGTNLTKEALLLQACEKLDVSVEDSIFIGDSEVDATGAENVGMDFAAALYGWGFRTREEAESYNCRAYLNSAADICSELQKI
ncbi:MAG: HAD hydrolase-like protein [Clostridiales bacterium]|nr:HAD hydrolase-like protein [Clostridiales bacterium]